MWSLLSGVTQVVKGAAAAVAENATGRPAEGTRIEPRSYEAITVSSGAGSPPAVPGERAASSWWHGAVSNVTHSIMRIVEETGGVEGEDDEEVTDDENEDLLHLGISGSSDQQHPTETPHGTLLKLSQAVEQVDSTGSLLIEESREYAHLPLDKQVEHISGMRRVYQRWERKVNRRLQAIHHHLTKQCTVVIPGDCSPLSARGHSEQNILACQLEKRILQVRDNSLEEMMNFLERIQNLEQGRFELLLKQPVTPPRATTAERERHNTHDPAHSRHEQPQQQVLPSTTERWEARLSGVVEEELIDRRSIVTIHNEDLQSLGEILSWFHQQQLVLHECATEVQAEEVEMRVRIAASEQSVFDAIQETACLAAHSQTDRQTVAVAKEEDRASAAAAQRIASEEAAARLAELAALAAAEDRARAALSAEHAEATALLLEMASTEEDRASAAAAQRVASEEAAARLAELAALAAAEDRARAALSSEHAEATASLLELASTETVCCYQRACASDESEMRRRISAAEEAELVAALRSFVANVKKADSEQRQSQLRAALSEETNARASIEVAERQRFGSLTGEFKAQKELISWGDDDDLLLHSPTAFGDGRSAPALPASVTATVTPLRHGTALSNVSTAFSAASYQKTTPTKWDDDWASWD